MTRGDLQWGTLPAMLRDSCARFPDQEAVVDGERRLTYAALGELVDRAARAAIAAGTTVGDRVAIWAPNSLEWIVAAFGTLAAGGAIVPLNTRYKAQEAGYVLAKSRTSTLFVWREFLGVDYLEMLRGELGGPAGDRPVDGLPELERVVVLGGQPAEASTGWDAFLDSGDRLDADLLDVRRQELTADSLSDILFTSGTTGRPKGAMLTHGQTLRQFADWTEIIGLRAGDRYLVVNPFFHVFGYKAGFLSALMRGAVVLPHPVFDVEEVMARIERERVTTLPGPPTIHQSILNHPRRDDYDLSSLRLCSTGAAEVPLEMIVRMRNELSYETIVTGYGLTECTGIATMCRHDDPPERIAATSGRAVPGVEVQIVDDDGRELPRGEQGEIVIRGYNVMLGYYDDPEETAVTIDDDGWLHSGDLGVMDDDGYVAITGRKKDMYIVGGFNVYPAEVENLFLGNPKVAEVAVVGVPDERLGEVGVAYVVPRAGAELGADELVTWARATMANFKVPRRVEIVESLPVNAAGKVMRFVLRERAAGGT